MLTPCRPTRLLWLLALLPLACQPATPDTAAQATAAKAQLMARHDSLMARMDELYKLRQQLQQLPDTGAAGRQRRALLRADAAMMDWMHQYRAPADTAAPARQLAYFAGQQQRIDSVGRLMQQSADSARRLLQPSAPAAGSVQ